MGAISKKLASRFRKAKKQFAGLLRRQATADFAQVPRDVQSVEALVRSGHDPLHAAYVAAQNFTSFFAESVSQFPEFAPYRRVVGPAQDEYLPSGPPMSPLTLSPRQHGPEASDRTLGLLAGHQRQSLRLLPCFPFQNGQKGQSSP
jgi:hypothetical protein